MSVPAAVVELVDQFERNIESYHSAGYNETQLRREFIDRLFEEALGWDISNRAGLADAYKDVVHEDAIRVGKAHKAPDYSFRIGGVRKFFLEAKKPSVNLRRDPTPAYQLRRYAWSSKLPLSVLTNFQEFAVYDCTVRPSPTDKPSVARVMYLTFDRYIDTWDRIAEVFSKEAILKGSFDKYAESARRKRGTSEVDHEFLDEIEGWRDLLARNIALRNPELYVRELNFAVQRTIDRIIFLRMCEDRGIENYGQLRDLLDRESVYPELFKIFHAADAKYNSGLFHFRPEKDRVGAPDTLTPQITIDDNVLKGIVRGIYYPESPYEFSVLPADILGSVYEQFLGKVIRLTPAHRAKVEEKPEIKKAGGVYYTPSFIVNYIVENTVGGLIKGRSPRQLEQIRILDPACGSGSFLLSAYSYLLDHHLAWYTRRRSKARSTPIYQGSGDQWHLTTREKKRILLNNIYGVDIDSQAVEVTKLNLLLKVLENENQDTLERQQKLWRERALPDLASNIRCGNSLIGPDFYSQQQLALINEDERYAVNPFDWKAEFSEITRSGGFDAVIGNPPYLNIDDTWGKGDARQRYLKRAFPAIYNDKTDILFYFLARAVQLTRGVIGVIVSRAFLEAYKADKLRGWLAENAHVREIIDFRNYYVFPGVGITTAIVILTKSRHQRRAKFYSLHATGFKPDNLGIQKGSDLFRVISVDQEHFGPEAWSFVGDDAEKVIQKIDAAGEPLADVLIVGQGMQTGRNSVFGKLDRSRIEGWRLKDGQYFTRARNSDILRYHIHDSGELILYVENVESFEDLPKGVREYLKSNEGELRKRAAYRRGDCEWWRYTWPLHKKHFHRAKLYCPYLAPSNRFAIDEEGEFLGLTDTTVLFDSDQQEELRYLLGLLNSRLLGFRFRFIGKLKSGGILEYFWNSVSKLPIRRIDLSNPSDKALHDKIVDLVGHILVLQEQLDSAKLAHDKEVIQRQVDATDRQIDQIVYELYNMSDEDISVVEML